MLAFPPIRPLEVLTPQGTFFLEHYFPVPSTGLNGRIQRIFVQLIAFSDPRNESLSPLSHVICPQIAKADDLLSAIAVVFNRRKTMQNLDANMYRALFRKAATTDQITTLFNAVPVVYRRTHHFNTFIARSIELGDLEKANSAGLLASVQGLADSTTYLLMIEAAFDNYDPMRAYAIFRDAVSVNLVTAAMYTRVIKESGVYDFDAAHQFFQAALEDKKADATTYNAMVAVAVNNNALELAEDLFMQALFLDFHLDRDVLLALERISVGDTNTIFLDNLARALASGRS